MHSVLEHIREGMKVVDPTQAEIGTVEWVKLSDEDPSSPQSETADVNPIDLERPHSLMTDLAEAFHPDELPEVLRARLLREGFIRLNAKGLFNADRYVLADQIQTVSGDRVILKVGKKELIKTH